MAGAKGDLVSPQATCCYFRQPCISPSPEAERRIGRLSKQVAVGMNFL
jgi:hypothetical protein